METLGIGNCFGPVFVSRAVAFQVWVQGCWGVKSYTRGSRFASRSGMQRALCFPVFRCQRALNPKVERLCRSALLSARKNPSARILGSALDLGFRGLGLIGVRALGLGIRLEGL